MPDEIELPEAPDDNARMEVRSRDTWKPRHSLEDAIERLSPEIRETLANRLAGEFREIRRYRPGRMLELEAAAGRENPASDGTPPADEELEEADAD